MTLVFLQVQNETDKIVLNSADIKASKASFSGADQGKYFICEVVQLEKKYLYLTSIWNSVLFVLTEITFFAALSDVNIQFSEENETVTFTFPEKLKVRVILQLFF